eukprot:g4843.t1
MTNGVPTYAMPLAFVLGITAIKDALEDYARHKADDEENDRVTKCFDRGSNSFVETKWSRVKVGDIIRLQNRDLVPADMAMISSSVENGLLYSMTANLDGETNLKLRKVNEEAALDTALFEDVELFVKALDADGDNMIGQTEFIDYMLRGMAMTPDERSKFARRSQMHAKLNRFVENILWRLDAEEL